MMTSDMNENKPVSKVLVLDDSPVCANAIKRFCDEHNLVGLKGTRGLLSTTGVVPACRTLDCVTYLTATAREASELLALTAKPDPRDAYSRINPQSNDASAFGEVPAFRFGVPSALEFSGCAARGRTLP